MDNGNDLHHDEMDKKVKMRSIECMECRMLEFIPETLNNHSCVQDRYSISS
jgi:hypothetical protein